MKVKKLLLTLIQLILIVIVIISSYYIYKWYNQNKHTEEIVNEIASSVTVVLDENKKSEEYNIDFEKLKENNSDTVAFLKVNNAGVEYPVVKTDNNTYYLTHSFDKKSNSAGWIFADCNNKFDGTDKNIVIYGHNRRDGSMFGTLKNILDKNWGIDKENRKIIFITENENCTYEVFSVYQIESEDFYIKTNFKTDAEFWQYVDIVRKRSMYDFYTDVSPEDSILTLSTCANNNKYRVVLHAKKN